MFQLNSNSKWAYAVVLFSALAIAGCGDKKGNEEKAGAQNQNKNISSDVASKNSSDKRTKKTVVPPPPPIAQVPPVVMSKQHRDKLEVFQNDALPAEVLDEQLVGLDGKSHSLRSELGQKLTVVLFWSSDHAYAAEELHYLATRVNHDFGQKGVKIVTINQRDNQQQASKAAGSAGASSLVTLLDSNKTLSQLADGSVPRTYLLDAEGRVLWLDIVFDRTTQRDLAGAINFVLNKS
jgi:hypothetical protein